LWAGSGGRETSLADGVRRRTPLTNPALDPFGRIPEFGFCAERAEKAEIRSAAE